MIYAPLRDDVNVQLKDAEAFIRTPQQVFKI